MISFEELFNTVSFPQLISWSLSIGDTIFFAFNYLKNYLYCYHNRQFLKIQTLTHYFTHKYGIQNPEPITQASVFPPERQDLLANNRP